MDQATAPPKTAPLITPAMLAQFNEQGYPVFNLQRHPRELATHCPGSGPDGGLQIPSRLIGGQPVPVPVKRGGALFMHRRTMHASLANRSDDLRWSFDLRYQPTGLPTGRPAFPGFVARSRLDPQSEQRDWRAWSQSWLEARARLAQGLPPRFNRWLTDAPACA